jgi:hypothetical protein
MLMLRCCLSPGFQPVRDAVQALPVQLNFIFLQHCFNGFYFP